MSEEFDIYGDDTFGSEIQVNKLFYYKKKKKTNWYIIIIIKSDDILGEIVGESTPQNRQAMKRKPTSQNPEDDLFEDFGEIDKVT